ncbi:MAG: signal peptidase II, partial [Pseudomonadota bacterium]
QLDSPRHPRCVRFHAEGRAHWAGRVIDFLNVGLGPFRTGIFNVADVAIMAGVAILLFEGYRSERSRPAGRLS